MLQEHEENYDVVEKVQVTYSEFGGLMEQLVKILYPIKNKFSAIHGLPRGGLSIAVHLSHYLELPLMMNVSQFNSEFPAGKILVVDDIIDTGKTFERFLEIAELRNIQFETAVLYYKPHSEYTPNYYLRETGEWIVFPWEKFEEIPNREKYEHLGGEIDSCDTDIENC